VNDRKVFDEWFEVVEEFSRLRLTRESDRLPALIGVATVFQARLNSGYLAGLWQMDIARGLLWDVTRLRYAQPESSVGRQRRPNVPSWSWASLTLNTDGTGIIFPSGHDETFQEDNRFAFLDSDLSTTATESNTGTQNGTLMIRGAAVEAISCPCQSLRSSQDLTLIFEQDVDDFVLVTTLGMSSDVTGSVFGDYPLKDGVVVSCLLIGKMIDDNWEFQEEVKYYCTIVLRSSVAVSGSYERIGVLDIKESTGIFWEASENVLKLT
jgi:hypothetical protein